MIAANHSLFSDSWELMAMCAIAKREDGGKVGTKEGRERRVTGIIDEDIHRPLLLPDPLGKLGHGLE